MTSITNASPERARAPAGQVKKALTKVDGVTKAVVSFENRETVVTFDDAKTTAQKLTKATEDAGYPSRVKR